MERTTTLLLTALLGIAASAQSLHRVFATENGTTLSPLNQCRLSDGGYLICGTDFPSYDFQLVRISASGDVLWGKQLPNNSGQEVFDVLAIGQFANGDIYLLASIYGPNPYPDRVLLRLDGTGTPVWTRKMVYTPDVYADYIPRASRVAETNMGDILVNVAAENRAVLTKLTSTGTLLWSKSFSNTLDPLYDKHPSFDMHVNGDGSALICGKDRDWPYLVQTDANGDMLWGHTYYDVYNYSQMRDMEVLPNGDLLFAGMHDAGAAMMRMNSSGTILWLKHYSDNACFQTLRSLGDGTFMIGSDGYGNILHVDADGNVLSAFAGGTADYSTGLHCISGANGVVHLAGNVVDNMTWGAYNYIARFPIDSPPECLYTPVAITTTDDFAMVGSSGTSTMVQSAEPVTVTAVNWVFTSNAWVSDAFCGAANTVPTVGSANISVTPTLLVAGATVQVDLGENTSAMADWFAMNGALVKCVAFNGEQATLSTAGLVPGLYTLRLSADGGVLHAARIVVQ